MVQSCSADQCNVRLIPGLKIKFHRFPKDPLLQQKWVAALRNGDFSPGRTAVVCEYHFRNEDYYVTEYGTKMLKKGSVPVPLDSTKIRPKIRRRTMKKKKRNISPPASDESEDGVEIISIERVEDDCDLSVAKVSETVDTNVQPSSSNGSSSCKSTALDNAQAHVEQEHNYNANNLNTEKSKESKKVDKEPSNSNIEYYVPCVCSMDDNTDNDSILDYTINTPNMEPDVSELNTQPTRTIHLKTIRRGRLEPAYFGDFKESDLECPRKRARYWTLSHELVKDYKLKQKLLRDQVIRQDAKNKSLGSLVKKLQKIMNLSDQELRIINQQDI